MFTECPWKSTTSRNVRAILQNKNPILRLCNFLFTCLLKSCKQIPWATENTKVLYMLTSYSWSNNGNWNYIPRCIPHALNLRSIFQIENWLRFPWPLPLALCGLPGARCRLDVELCGCCPEPFPSVFALDLFQFVLADYCSNKSL